MSHFKQGYYWAGAQTWIQLCISIPPSDVIWCLQCCTVDYGCLCLYSPATFFTNYHFRSIAINPVHGSIFFPSPLVKRASQTPIPTWTLPEYHHQKETYMTTLQRTMGWSDKLYMLNKRGDQQKFLYSTQLLFMTWKLGLIIISVWNWWLTQELQFNWVPILL